MEWSCSVGEREAEGEMVCIVLQKEVFCMRATLKRCVFDGSEAEVCIVA